MNFEFVPRLQTVSGCLSLLNSTLLLAVGVAFLAFPRWVLSVLLDYKPGHDSLYGCKDCELRDQRFDHRVLHHEDPIDSAASLIGGVLVSQGLACLLLLYPMMSEGFSSTPLASVDRSGYSGLTIWNVRTSVTMQLITGLIWIVVALYDDRGNEAVVRTTKKDEFGAYVDAHSVELFVGVHRRTTFGLLLVGFAILVLGCFGMMLTFWPATSPHHFSSRRSTTPTRGTEQDLVLENPLTEPLLGRDEEIQNSVGSLALQGEREGDDEHDAVSTTTDESNAREDGDQEGEVLQTNNDLEQNRGDVNISHEENHTDEPTSRIRGTQRLLAVAAPQVVYLYIGCITLLIRLPFSLSIPHFVSTTLGALADREFDRARREIIWLFILGTIDAFLDFWCIFCKLGNESHLYSSVLQFGIDCNGT